MPKYSVVAWGEKEHGIQNVDTLKLVRLFVRAYKSLPSINSIHIRSRECIHCPILAWSRNPKGQWRRYYFS